MPRPRADSRKRPLGTTASAPHGSGCSFGLILPPLAVLIFGCLLAAFVGKYSTVEPQPVYAQGTISPIFTEEIQYWSRDILRWSADFSLDPNLAATVMQIESCGDPFARSSAGAMGLFQVMPFHFYASDDSFSPDINAQRGLEYLARSYERAGGDASLALAGYNGGIGLIGRGEWSWPEQTKRYVYFGEGIYADARAGLTVSARLDEWYAKFGAGLCAQAALNLHLP